MKILLITDDVWNDKIYTNNVLTNWFEGFDAEFANIYLAPGVPDNKCCNKYFQITDKMMLKSIFTHEKAGRMFEQGNGQIAPISTLPEEGNRAFYSFMKAITTETIRALKDWIWLTGQYNNAELEKFISDFGPDIIFVHRLASRKVLRFERNVAELTNIPFAVFTGDDEYTLTQIRFSPIYWIRRLLLRKDFRNTICLYSKYYTLSLKQANMYRKLFNVDADVLMKCGDFSEDTNNKKIHSPIKMIYAGRLYCNRWKTLIKIKKALEKINNNKVRMILEIYTKDKITKFQRNQLDDGINSFLKSPVDAEELKLIYSNSDIALHVESFDLKNRLITKYSFSTKIIDCLASSCAVVAICSKSHPGYQYLKEKDAAICIGRSADIYSSLKGIANHQKILIKYQEKCRIIGFHNHRKSVVQEKLYKEMLEIIDSRRNINGSKL